MGKYYKTDPKLLAMLKATVSTDIFETTLEGEEKKLHEEQCRDIWEQFFVLAAHLWENSHDSDAIFDRKEVGGRLGTDLFDMHDGLIASCVQDSFNQAIIKVANSGHLPEENDRDFLYYMLGMLNVSWEEHLRQGSPVNPQVQAPQVSAEL